MSLYIANKENLENFISDMRISFQNLKVIRKQYLNKILNYINTLLNQIKNNTKTFNNNFNFNNDNNIGKNKYNKIMNLVLSLDNFSEILEIYSEEKKEEFKGILSLILNELENDNNEIKSNNNKGQNFPLNKEINKLKNKLNEEQKKIKELEAQNNELFKMNKMNENILYDKDNKILSLNEDIKSMDFQLKEYKNEIDKNKDIIKDLKNENILMNILII